MKKIFLFLLFTLIFTGCDPGLNIINTGRVQVNSTPDSAKIFINGVNQDKFTPAIIELNQGEYLLELTKSQYLDSSLKINVVANKLGVTGVRLTSAESRIFVNSEPDSARILLNEELTNKFTPDTLYLYSGEYNIGLRKYDYYDSLITVSVNKNETKILPLIKLDSKLMKVIIGTEPNGAEIFLNGINTGKFSPDTLLVYEGDSELLLKKENCYDSTFTINVKRNEIIKLENIKLDKLPAIVVSTEPMGASIFLNGNNTGKSTPDTVIVIDGTHKITLKRNEFNDTILTLHVVRNEVKILNKINLVLTPGKLIINSSPSGAEIIVHGTNIISTTPDTLSLYKGTYQLTLRKTPYKDTTLSVKIENNQSTNLGTVILPALPGKLFVNSSPEGALILINGITQDKFTPDTLSLPKGTYQITLRKSPHKDTTMSVFIVSNQITNLGTVTLPALPGKLYLRSIPTGALITINGISQNKFTPDTLTLYPGTYQITLNRLYFLDTTFNITIQSNQFYQNTITLRYNFNSMVFVQGGTFTMGCTNEQGADCFDFEKPQSQVTLSSFYIGRYEVNQKVWKEIMGFNPSHYIGDQLPVANITWYEAVAFCNGLSQREGLTPVYTINLTYVTADWNANGYRLPTEAEWEYAARGGVNAVPTKYAGSNNIDLVAWYYLNSGLNIQGIGNKQQNELSIYDMSGNVFEWCWDWSGSYSSSPKTNPKGPALGDGKINRGGGVRSHERIVRTTHRSAFYPSSAYFDIGFRIARNAD